MAYQNNGKNNFNKKQGYGNYQRNMQTSTYVGAPYNFVSFSRKVYEYQEEKLTAHNDVSENLITGELNYEIEAKTPVFIDDGKGHFHRDPYGRFSIPGSSIRGLIRSNVQILGLASINDDIDDYALMYRNVANGAEKDRYNAILGSKQLRINDGNKQYGIGVLTNVRAGYVKNENGKYIIYQTKVDSIKKEFARMNYYSLSERKVVKAYNDSKKNHTPFAFDAFLRNGKSIMQHEFTDRGFNKEVIKGRVHYKGARNQAYCPYCIEVSYELKNEKDITAVGKPGKYKHSGYAVSTGKMNEKKVIYIVPQIDENKDTIPIPEKDVNAFRIDLNKREKTLKQFGGREFFDLPKPGKMKCIFYIQLDGKLYFGFTPRLRLFYDHTIKDGLNAAHKPEILDYSKALFGYSNNNGSYKSRLSFSDAVVIGDEKEEKEHSVVLAEPKASSYLDYVRPQQDGKGMTYNKDGFELRGIKQYWLHTKPLQSDTNPKNENVGSALRPLKQGVRFSGKIRFRNLTKEELGLLLWSVQLKPESWMNIGKGKAYGYGNIKLKIVDLKKIDAKEAYSLSEGISLNPFVPVDADEMIACYKEQMNLFLKEKNEKKTIDDMPHIKEFFRMKDSTCIPDENDIRYMSIDKKEYQSRTKPLPYVSQMLKKNGN